MAFVEEQSASGFLVPLAMLHDEGLSLKSLSYYNFVGMHNDVARSVLKGDLTQVA